MPCPEEPVLHALAQISNEKTKTPESSNKHDNFCQPMRLSISLNVFQFLSISLDFSQLTYISGAMVQGE